MNIFQGSSHKLLYHCVIVVDEMGLMVVIQSLLDFADLVVGKADGRKSWGLTWVDRQAPLIYFDRFKEIPKRRKIKINEYESATYFCFR
jgi:hypothetical protein